MNTHYFIYRFGKTILLLLIGFPLFVKAQQTGCPNSNFSSKTFTNWVGYTSCYPFNTPGTNIATPNSGIDPPAAYYYKEGIVSGRHTIMTGSYPDPYTCGNVMTLPPNEKTCVRLGNGGRGTWGNGVAWQREFLYYTFQITDANALLIYKYAVILQDPSSDPIGGNSHTKELRPRFIVSIRDQSGKLIDSVCGTKEDFADSTVAGYKKCAQSDIEKLGGNLESPGGVIYREWTTAGVDLRKFIGTSITIGFETWDCGLGGHFGYAYLTAKCAPMKIKVSNCFPADSVTLTAPEGFIYKWSSGQTTQSIVVYNPQVGDTAIVELTSLTGCKSVVKTILFQNTSPNGEIGVDSVVCAGSPMQFRDKSIATNDFWYWNFGDGTTDTVQNPIHVFPTVGSYDVTLLTRNTDGCSDTIYKKIDITCSSVGIKNLTQTVNVRAYPNPSTGTFKLQVGEGTPGVVQVSVTNILGQTIYAESNTVKNGVLQKELDLQAQPDGLYFLTIKSGEYSGVIKLVKKN